MRNQKQALSTSLRSATQATDSTCSGCNANKNATNALRQRVPVARSRKMHNKMAASACSRTLCRWCQPLSRPKNWAVEHVRNPGHREPVGGIARCQRPFQPLRGEPLPDVQVAGGVIGIVVVDEIEVADLRVDRESGQEQRQINQQIETRAGEHRVTFPVVGAAFAVTPAAFADCARGLARGLDTESSFYLYAKADGQNRRRLACVSALSAAFQRK